jgi:hypothetical protein
LPLGLVLAAALFAASNSVILWRDPGPVESLDMTGGPGGRARAPQPPFAFVKEQMDGTSPKVILRDARGTEWMVKFGEEVKAENFASRIVWAAGYFAEPTYFVSEGVITGVTELGRAQTFIDRASGQFRDARFELRDDSLRAGGKRWSLSASELKDSRELAGYKVLLILLANWDVKPENLTIVNKGGQPIYAITDWGATMGRAAEITGRSKWDCVRYEADSANLIEGVENGFVVFNYHGKQGHEVLRGIRVEDVQWLMQRLGKLSDAQIDAALQASGATPEEVACFGRAFRSRLGQLMTVSHSSPEGEVTRTRREIRTTIRKRE